MAESLLHFSLTQEEFDHLYSLIEQAEGIAQDRSWEPGDEEDLEHSRLARLENELLWQAAHGTRRPVQQ